jgi:hypothetical protein
MIVVSARYVIDFTKVVEVAKENESRILTESGRR